MLAIRDRGTAEISLGGKIAGNPGFPRGIDSYNIALLDPGFLVGEARTRVDDVTGD